MRTGSMTGGILLSVTGAMGLMALGSGIAIVGMNLLTNPLGLRGASSVFVLLGVSGLLLVANGFRGDSNLDLQQVQVEEPKKERMVRNKRTAVAPQPSPALSDLDLTALKAVSRGIGIGEIARSTGLDARVISEKVSMLLAEGYITESNYLTAKGFQAVRAERARELPKTVAS